MNQPQLGLKVADLRQQKGLTQEQLAERCEVSARTLFPASGYDRDRCGAPLSHAVIVARGTVETIES